MDLKKLTTANWILGGSGVALFFFSFLPWFTLGGFGSRSAWSNLFSMLAVLLAMVTVVVLVIDVLLEADLPELPIAMSQAYLVASGIVLVLIILQLLVGDSVGPFDLDRGVGLWLGLLAGIGMVVGGVLEVQATDGTSNGKTPPQPF